MEVEAGGPIGHAALELVHGQYIRTFLPHCADLLDAPFTLRMLLEVRRRYLQHRLDGGFYGEGDIPAVMQKIQACEESIAATPPDTPLAMDGLVTRVANRIRTRTLTLRGVLENQPGLVFIPRG